MTHKETDHESEGSTEDWQPTDQQRVALTHAFILRQRCLSLGIDWDPRVLRKDQTLNTKRYNKLRMKMGRALIPQLAHQLNEGEPWGSETTFFYTFADSDKLGPCLSLSEAMRIAMRIGWIETARTNRGRA